MKYFFWICTIIVFSSCAVSKHPQKQAIRNQTNGKARVDSSFVYMLPFQQGKSFRVVQGYFSSFSHKNRAALDFKMRRGTEIRAARTGIVVRAKSDGSKGGLNKKYRQDGNFVIIQHMDSSRAGYWHLQKEGVVVGVGDTVQQGQLIGYSGKTGYAAIPHLHFLVWKNNGRGQWIQEATRFETSRGIKYLQFFKKYKRP